MNSTELVSFISQIQGRLDSVEGEWKQWKSLVSINPRSQELWSNNTPSGEWILLGTLRCSQDILPLEVNQPVHLGSQGEPFESQHLRTEINFVDGTGRITAGSRTAWFIDGIGCQGFGNIVSSLAANFHFVGRGGYQLQGVEVGDNWLRVHFPEDWQPEKKQISMFLHLNDRVEVDGVIRRVERWDTPDKAILDEPFPIDVIEDWKNGEDRSSFVKTIKVYPVWLAGHLSPEDVASEESPFLTITDDGRLFYRSIPSHATDGKSMVWKGDIEIDGNVKMNNIEVNEMRVDSASLVKNLNAELWNGFRAPKLGEVVSTLDEQELIKKSFGDHVDMKGHRLMRVGRPEGGEDAVNRDYLEEWIQGIRPIPPVRACFVGSMEDLGERKEENGKVYWEGEKGKTLHSMNHLFDDVIMRAQDTFLVRGVGVLQIESDMTRNRGWIFSRRPDFLPPIKQKDTRGIYVWCMSGKEYGRTSWVSRGIEKEEWIEGETLEFFLYYQAAVSQREFGRGLQQSGDGRIELSVNRQIFDVATGFLNIVPKSIQSNVHLNLNYIDLSVSGGLKVSQPRVQLGELCQVELSYNPEQFYINGQNQLSLSRQQRSYRIDSGNYVEWTDGVRMCRTVEVERDILLIEQASPPIHFQAEFRVAKTQKTTDSPGQKYWVQYWIASQKNNKLTTAVSSFVGSQELYGDLGDKWFVKLSWDTLMPVGGFRLWRVRTEYPITDMNHYPALDKEGMECSYIDFDADVKYCLDILYPISFQKLRWLPFDGNFPMKNETQKIRGRLSSNPGDPTGFMNTPFGIGTLAPQATTLQIEEAPLSSSVRQSEAAIRIRTQPIPGGRGQVRWETVGNPATAVPYNMDWMFAGGHRSRLEVGGNDTVLSLCGDKNRLWIAPESWKGSRKVINTDDRVIVKEGGLRVEGRVSSMSPDGFETEGTDLTGNPAVLKTAMQPGYFVRPVGNSVAFSWKGGDLEAIPMTDGKQSASAVPIKQFTVEHPLDSSRWLQHACLEGPLADVYQRGVININSAATGRVKINLPDYWYALVESGTETVQLTPMGGPLMVWYDIDENRDIYVCWKYEPSTDSHALRVSYWIVGKRRDANFDVSPKKTDVEVHRVGPYSWTM